MAAKKTPIADLLDFLEDKRALCWVIKILIKTNLLDQQQISDIEKMITNAWHTATTKREQLMLQKTLEAVKKIKHKEQKAAWQKPTDERLQNKLKDM